SFGPRTSVLRPSMVEMPVWMNSAGCSREYGLIAAPVMSTRFSGTIGGPPSIGSPAPPRMRPSISRETFSLIVSPRNLTVDWRSIPALPSNTCTRTMSFDQSRTWPLFRDPSGRATSTRSPDPTHSVFSTPLGRAERVDRMIRVLLEEDFADHPGDLERELLVRRQGVRTDKTDDFLELRLFLQRPLRPRSQPRPVLVHVLPEPVLQDLGVQAVRLKPVDGREVPPSPQGGVQRPEHLHDAEGALGDGLREVPAARGHRADDADGPFEAGQRLRPTGTLVELAQPRGQVCREAFLARHLFEPTRNLSHRLGPSGCRVRHQGDVVSHVSVVFGERHPGVHGRLPRGDRHVALVRDGR